MALTYALNAPGTPPRTREAARPRKGDATRAAIVEAALALARRDGLEGLTIGVLAERMRMSKSGVFAHFGSREELQLAVIREYAARFVDEVLRPAVQRPRGLPRLRALLARWLALLARELTQGCLMISGASEYDDRPGPLRDAVVVIGSEGRGLSPAVRACVTQFITIPKYGGAESLNAGVAAAIVCDNLRRALA